jgi:Na+-driven multidrug efflux pump
MGAGSRILANAIAAKGSPQINMYTSAFVMILNIILNIILIPKYGLLGAAVATSIAYSINTILRVWLFSKLENTFKIVSLIITFNDLIYLKNKLRVL